MIAIKASFPVLVTSDISKQRDFYVEHFGFNAVYFDESFFVHLLHPATGIQVAFMMHDHPSQPSFLHPVAGKDGMVISFEVDDVRSALGYAEQSDLDIVFQLKEEPFGQIHFMVKDPSGFIVDIVEDHNE